MNRQDSHGNINVTIVDPVRVSYWLKWIRPTAERTDRREQRNGREVVGVVEAGGESGAILVRFWRGRGRCARK